MKSTAPVAIVETATAAAGRMVMAAADLTTYRTGILAGVAKSNHRVFDSALFRPVSAKKSFVRCTMTLAGKCPLLGLETLREHAETKPQL